MADVLKLTELKPADVPADLKAETYFDFAAHPFAHQALLEQSKSVYDAILGIDDDHDLAATNRVDRLGD